MCWSSLSITARTVSPRDVNRHHPNVNSCILIDNTHSLRLLQLARDPLWPAEQRSPRPTLRLTVGPIQHRQIRRRPRKDYNLRRERRRRIRQTTAREPAFPTAFPWRHHGVPADGTGGRRETQLRERTEPLRLHLSGMHSRRVRDRYPSVRQQCRPDDRLPACRRRRDIHQQRFAFDPVRQGKSIPSHRPSNSY